jgi:hypothetical protein
VKINGGEGGVIKWASGEILSFLTLRVVLNRGKVYVNFVKFFQTNYLKIKGGN